MIKTNISKSFKKYDKIIFDKCADNCNKKQLHHLWTVDSYNFMLANEILEDILFAIQTKECTDTKEIADFINKCTKFVIVPKIETGLTDA